MDVEHGAQATAVLRGVRAFVQTHVPNGIRVKRGKKTKCVGRVVKRHLIQEDQGLIRAPAADVQPGTDIRRGLNAGQEVEGPQNIRLANGGHLADLRGLDFDESRLNALFFLLALGLHHDLLHRDGFGLELHVEPPRFPYAQGERVLKTDVPDVRDGQDVLGLCGDAPNGVVPIDIAQRADGVAWSFQDHTRIRQGFAIALIRDEPAQGRGPNRLRQDRQQHQNFQITPHPMLLYVVPRPATARARS